MKRYIRPLLSLLVTLLAVLFIAKNWSQFAGSLSMVMHGSSAYFLLSTPLVLATFVLAAFSYKALAWSSLRLLPMICIEFAAAVATRLLPAGVGGMGVHVLYLRKQKHSLAQASTVVAVNNTLGFVLHSAMLVSAVALSGNAFARLDLDFSFNPTLVVVLAVCLFGAMFTPWARQRIFKAWHAFSREFRAYRTKPHKLIYSGLSLMTLTITNVLVLFLAAHSFAPELFQTFDAAQLLIIYSTGILLGSLVPTPGGLAGVEAGLVAGFVAYDVPAETALAITIAFRFVTYWLPLVPGFVALYYSRRKRWI